MLPDGNRWCKMGATWEQNGSKMGAKNTERQKKTEEDNDK